MMFNEIKLFKLNNYIIHLLVILEEFIYFYVVVWKEELSLSFLLTTANASCVLAGFELPITCLQVLCYATMLQASVILWFISCTFVIFYCIFPQVVFVHWSFHTQSQMLLLRETGNFNWIIKAEDHWVLQWCALKFLSHNALGETMYPIIPQQKWCCMMGSGYCSGGGEQLLRFMFVLFWCTFSSWFFREDDVKCLPVLFIYVG